MKPFRPNTKIERTYGADVLGAVRRFFRESYDVVTTQLLTVPEWYEAYAKQAAERMVTHQLYEGARSWREAARKAGRGAELYAGLQQELRGGVGRRYRELITENTQYIKTLPHDIAQQVTVRMAAAARGGERAASGMALLQHASRVEAMRLARTETAKAQAALTQARSEQLGLAWYVWQTSEDARVRLAHRRMKNVLFRFDDPPSPEALVGLRSVGHYNAGNIFNCRCYSEPLLRFLQVTWPHRVYWNGGIRYMTLNQFREINKFNAALAA